MSNAAIPDWLRLQKQLFSRWCNQKLELSVGIKVDDVVNQLGDPHTFKALLEVLSEKEFGQKLSSKPKSMRVVKIDDQNRLLDWCFSRDIGVQMKLKPSANDLVDGDERRVLGLVFSLMLTFLRFDDGDEDGPSLGAKEALLQWARGKVNGYANTNQELKDFGSVWKTGMPFLAVLHKSLGDKAVPNFETFSADNRAHNLNVYLDACEKFLGVERFIEPEDIQKVDEAGMFVLVAELYFSLARMRKVLLAARRTNKLIKFTVENDAMKAEYVKTSQEFQEHVKKVEVILEDRTIDNTMAGAKRRIEEFYNYKTNDKGEILRRQLELEAIYNNLAMRLAHRKRPAFVPPAGATLEDIARCLAHLEKCEAERKIALHAELNRQVRLLAQDGHHQARTSKIEAWRNEKQQYLDTKEVSDSVGAAQYQLKRLDAYDQESTVVQDVNVAALVAIGDELEAEKYERADQVRAREATVAEWFTQLNAASQAKRPVLECDLAREEFRAELFRQAENHASQHAKLMAWVKEKQQYLETRESIDTLPLAQTHLALLQGYDKENQVTRDTLVSALNALGQEILTAKYSGPHSEYVFEKPEDIQQREAQVQEALNSLEALKEQKKAFLEAEKEREQKKEELRLAFAAAAGDFTRWTRDRIDATAVTHFGFDLEEVEKFGETLNDEDGQLNQDADAMQEAYKDIHQQGVDLGVKENVYASQSLSDLDAVRQQLTNAIQERQQKYNAELQRQRENDALCKQFAEAADPLFAFVNETKVKITNSTDSLNAQLLFVEERIAKLDEEGAALGQIDSLQQQIDEKKITNNRHTTLTAKDCHVQWSQWQRFLETKKRMLNEAIENDKLKGVSPQEFEEINENYTQYDKGAKGHLVSRELKALLYSLGEDVGKQQIAKIMSEAGNGKEITKEQFIAFMITLVGDSDSLEETISGLKLINGSEIAIVEKMERVLEQSDIDYITSTAPAVDGGYDYKTWSADMYAR